MRNHLFHLKEETYMFVEYHHYTMLNEYAKKRAREEVSEFLEITLRLVIEGKVDPSVLLQYLQSPESIERFANDCVFDQSGAFLKPTLNVYDEEEDFGQVWIEDEENELKH